MTTHYFATDGNYGDNDGMLTVVTDTWTDEMWELIDSATDSMRIVIAHRFAHGYTADEVEKDFFQ